MPDTLQETQGQLSVKNTEERKQEEASSSQNVNYIFIFPHIKESAFPGHSLFFADTKQNMLTRFYSSIINGVVGIFF